MEQWQRDVLNKLRDAKEIKAPVTFKLYEIIKLIEFLDPEEMPLFRWHDHDGTPTR